MIFNMQSNDACQDKSNIVIIIIKAKLEQEF